MGFATHLGPWLLGTVKNTTGTTAGTIRNMGATIVAQTYTAPTSVILATPAAQQMFVLPAGAKIVRFGLEVNVALTGATNCGVTIGSSGTANLYMASVTLALRLFRLPQLPSQRLLQVFTTTSVQLTQSSLVRLPQLLLTLLPVRLRLLLSTSFVTQTVLLTPAKSN